jgi:deoxyribose-phosphate aldolase
MNYAAAAKLALQCLDLTSLNDNDDEAAIEKLCQRAQGPHGNVAAVCVWPQWVALARSKLPAGIAVAAVANFPHGSTDTERAVTETNNIAQAGGQEVDVVLPYHALIVGKELLCAKLLRSVRRAAKGLTLKVILETGELKTPVLIERAAQIAIDNGADFIKTSTGKTDTSATLEAAEIMLKVIARQCEELAKRLGLKPSGGIRTVAEAAQYIQLAQQFWGADAVTPARFRIGASSLLNDIEAVLSGKASAPSSTGY